MPGVSFYLDQSTLDTIKAKSKASHKPVSSIIREAVEQYLSRDAKKAAKKRVLSTLSKSRPLGGLKKWEGLHKERTGADADRR
ncbi:MAG: CopG family transcriptional regulator [Nitrospinae bacterium]|nr:CopG family transcriptional regulator [Nitrospinota bacterium]